LGYWGIFKDVESLHEMADYVRKENNCSEISICPGLHASRVVGIDETGSWRRAEGGTKTVEESR
ncbi:hypothetical protein FPOAC1_007817, partial [Fusarium poae]|uniref:hypothetical protein n=1 Tax=Fusarium poae TaxID=36050 RepID=UPI001CEB1DE8